MTKNILLPLLWIIAQAAQAELLIPGISSQNLNPLATQDQTLARAGLTSNQDDITSDQNLNELVLNPKQIHEAKVWGLTIEEEKRYVFLMQNRSQFYYKGLRLNPLDILGLNARNETERNHFAELAAAQEAQKVAKNIAWNNAFYKAYNKLFANISVVGDFDPTPYSPYAHKPVQLSPGEMLYLFIKPDDPVVSIILSIVDAINSTPNTYLHIMLLESDDIAIQLWANQHQLSQQLVNNGRITLNHGDLHFQSLQIKNKLTPLLILAKDGKSNIVDLGRF
ncbi:bile acid beta-glucosidase [Legionella busanensis]|uniref:Bile acid beta-glucosidase n=1 Tax=Legionella busanensis TaxID=190655 RepID=A0A378JIQ5_9GAMM|nr:TIGR03759 family integrating conjugative element protein [Legionella busanensis]STX50937.1 bile acid beta-glucosidase [Legionella busanensis]